MAKTYSSSPKLARVFFEEDQVDAKEVWKCCVNYQAEWEAVDRLKPEIQQRMKDFQKQRAMNMIWASNKLEDTLPIDVSQGETFDILGKIYEGETIPYGVNSVDECAETKRKSKQQLQHHLEAYFLLCRPSTDTFQPLSEDLIKSTHEKMMQGLLNDDGIRINAGSYRQIPVHAGTYVFPDFNCIPRQMARIMSQYEEKFQDKRHDPFQLASWLLFEVVSLHPFEDGNGRLCRLLWCYSLMRDGLPFPLTPSSGHSSAQKHFVRCIQRDRKQFQSQSALTMLTVVSVKSAWKNFYFNIKYELN